MGLSNSLVNMGLINLLIFFKIFSHT
jgi:hypothetical protein